MDYLLYFIIWYCLGLVGIGFIIPYWDNNFPNTGGFKREDLGFGMFFSIFGPIFTIIVFFLTGFGEFGWSLHKKV